jgi:hypothetical protein
VSVLISTHQIDLEIACDFLPAPNTVSLIQIKSKLGDLPAFKHRPTCCYVAANLRNVGSKNKSAFHLGVFAIHFGIAYRAHQVCQDKQMLRRLGVGTLPLEALGRFMHCCTCESEPDNGTRAREAPCHFTRKDGKNIGENA